MKKYQLVFLVIFYAPCFCMAKTNTPTRQKNISEVHMEYSEIPGEDVSITQVNYLKHILESAILVVSGKSTLENEDKKETFGQGEYFWPKSGVPTSRFYKNREIGITSISFDKDALTSTWIKGSVSIEPLTFPKSIFKIDLTKNFFNKLKLEERYTKTVEDKSTPEVTYVHPIPDQAFFVYRTTGLPHDVRIRFTTSQRTVDIKRDLYPKRFYTISIERID